MRENLLVLCFFGRAQSITQNPLSRGRLNLVAFIWNEFKDVPGPDFSRFFVVEMHNLRSGDGILGATDTR